MFHVVDQWGKCIRTFEDRDSAEQFCERWNDGFRFSKVVAPKAHVEEAE